MLHRIDETALHALLGEDCPVGMVGRLPGVNEGREDFAGRLRLGHLSRSLPSII